MLGRENLHSVNEASSPKLGVATVSQKGGLMWRPETSIANSRFPAPGAAEGRRGVLLPLLATECDGEVGSGCYAGSLQWL